MKKEDLKITLFTIFMIFIAFLVILFAVKNTNKEQEQKINNCNLKKEKEPLQSFEDNNKTSASLSGGFFLGIGSIQGSSHTDLTYSFYRFDGVGYIFQNIPTNQGRIVEDENSQPYVNILCRVIYSHVDLVDDSFEDFYEFHIPKNSILRNFSADMQ